MTSRRRFFSDSLKILLGAGIGFVGTEYADSNALNGLRMQQQTSKPSDTWWMEQPLNPNGDFSEGEKYWKGGWVQERVIQAVPPLG